jgi:hypothetical protein
MYKIGVMPCNRRSRALRLLGQTEDAKRFVDVP